MVGFFYYSEIIYKEKFNETTPMVTNIFKKCYELEVLYFDVMDNFNFDLTNDNQLPILINGKMTFSLSILKI